MTARWPSGLFVMRKLSPPGWIATSRVSFEMSTPTLCAIVDLVFSQSSSCLGGMTPGCPFRPLGKERWSNYRSVLSDWRAHDPSPPAAGLCRKQAGGARSCRIRRENDKTRRALRPSETIAIRSAAGITPRSATPPDLLVFFCAWTDERWVVLRVVKLAWWLKSCPCQGDGPRPYRRSRKFTK